MLMMGIFIVLSGYFAGSIAYVEHVIFFKYACDHLRFLVCRSSLCWNMLLERYEIWAIKMANELAKELGVSIALIIDDTLVEKDNRSKCLAIGGKKKSIVGFSFLTGLLVVGRVSIPLIPQLCFRRVFSELWGIEYVSKVDKAQESIGRWIGYGLDVGNSIVILDSWYSSNKLINYCQSIPDLNYVFGIKSNRQLDKMAVRTLKHGIMNSKCKNINKKGNDYYLALRRGKLNKVEDEVNVLISKRENRRSGDISWRYFVTNIGEELAVLEWIRTRWQIETFHQIFKHRFKPEKWRVHGVERLCHLTILVTVAMGYAVKYYLDQHIEERYSLERILEHNMMADSLSFIRHVLISNEATVKSFLQSKT